MDNLNLNKYISGQFNAELEHILTQVTIMGGMVEQQLTDAITAMHNQDSELARRMIDGDQKVNMMEVEIDEACVRIIAKRQPTASDLRLVMAIIKTISELERIGDRYQHARQPLNHPPECTSQSAPTSVQPRDTLAPDPASSD